MENYVREEIRLHRGTVPLLRMPDPHAFERCRSGNHYTDLMVMGECVACGNRFMFEDSPVSEFSPLIGDAEEKDKDEDEEDDGFTDTSGATEGENQER